MEFDVQGEELVLLVALPGGPKPGSQGHELASALQRNALRGEPRGLRLYRAAKFVQRAQLVKPARGSQAPADDLGIVEIPAFLPLDNGSEPAPGFQHAHGTKHLRRLADHRPGHLVLGFQLVDTQHRVRGDRAVGNSQAQPFQKRRGRIFGVLRHWSLHK